MASNSLFILVLCLSVSYGLSCKDVVFKLYKRNSTAPVVMSAKNASRSEIERTWKSVFIVHGYNSDSLAGYLVAIRDALLLKEQANVFMVDWSPDAVGVTDADYFKIANEVVPQIGNQINSFIRFLGLKMQFVHCIGHSLGAHVCGFVGKKSKLGRISALDAAGPIFQNKPREEKLDIEDASFVDAIHTDIVAGYTDPIGHADFFPNGGYFQPGCNNLPRNSLDQILGTFALSAQQNGLAATIQLITQWAICSHARAPILFAESILSECVFKAFNCENAFFYTIRGIQNRCTLDGVMGYYASNKLRGKYYLETNSAIPYCVQ